MELTLRPAYEKLIDAKVRRGEFESRSAVVEYALRLLETGESNGVRGPLWETALPEEQAMAFEKWVA